LEPVSDESAPGTLALRTLLSRSTASVDDDVLIRCVLTDGERFFNPKGEVAALVSPAPTQMRVDGTSIHLIAGAPGRFQIQCQHLGTADPVGATLTVASPGAATWSVSIPDAPCVTRSDRLHITVDVRDRFGAQVLGPAVAYSASPADGVTGSLATGLRFSVDGRYRITVRYEGPVDGAALPPAMFDVLVDSTPPEVAFTEPARASMLEQSSSVALSGYAADELSPIDALEVNGALQRTSARRREIFSLAYDARFGLSVPYAVAVDACGNTGYATLPFLRSDAYAPITTLPLDPGSSGTALALQLSQTFVDDSDRTDIDDLATVGQLAVNGIDLDAMVAAGTVLAARAADTGCSDYDDYYVDWGFALSRHSSTSHALLLGDVAVESLDILDDGLSFAMTVRDLSFPLRVVAQVVTCIAGEALWVSLPIDAEFGFERMHVGGELYATLEVAGVRSALFDTAGLYLDLDCGVLDVVCDLATGAILAAAETTIEAAVVALIEEMASAVLTERLTALEIARSIPLVEPLAGELQVLATLSDIRFAEDALAVSLTTQIYTEDRGLPYRRPIRGAAALGGSLPTADAAAGSFAIAVKLDLLNQALWAVWFAGVLEIPDLAAVAGDRMPENSSASISAELPPILMPGEGGNLLELGLGDLRVIASIDAGRLMYGAGASEVVDVEMSVSLVAGAELVLEEGGNKIRLETDSDPEIYFEIDVINDLEYGDFVAAKVSDLVMSELPAILSEALQAVELPTLDMGAVPGVPADTTWGLRAPSISYETGYLTFAGEVGLVR
jgi:hypothetical protein